MVQLTDTEAALVDQLLNTVEEVLVELPDVDPVYANKTKLQKLLYLAIDEFDLPITYSWYLAGAVIPDRSIGPDAVSSSPSTFDASETPFPEVNQPSITNESTAPESPSIDPILFSGDSADARDDDSTSDITTYVSRKDLRLFYRQEIPDVWHQQTMRFLQNFYQGMAPDDYRLLYIESTHLRTNLSELIDTVEAHVEGEQPTRSIAMIRESIELSISDLHYQLRQNTRLSHTFDVVVAGTDFIEDVLMKIEQCPRDELTEDHLVLLEELSDFFYSYVWKYPCLLISQDTATGFCADNLSSAREREFESFDDRIRNKQGELAAEFESVNLLPDPDDYPPVDNREIAQRVSDLSSRYYK